MIILFIGGLYNQGKGAKTNKTPLTMVYVVAYTTISE